VIWSEGLLLSHQHLQQSDRAIRHLLHERLQRVFPFGWGFSGLKLDHDAARNGRIAIASASGVFRGGSSFELPGEDPLPASRLLEGHFDARAASVEIHLGLSSGESGRAQRGARLVPGAAGPRYDADTVELEDETIGQNPRPVEVQRRHFQLLFPDEALAEHDALPVGRIQRAGNGYAWDEAFIPPALSLAASPRLQRELNESYERLLQRYRELAMLRAQHGGAATFAAKDASQAIRLMCIGRHVPALARALKHPATHPWTVFDELAELAGELCSLHETIEPSAIPVYDHARIEESFDQLRETFVQLLKPGGGPDVVLVTLERGADDQWAAQLADERLVSAGWQMILGLRADISEVEYVSVIPKALKVATQERLKAILEFGLAGLPLEHLNAPPAGLPAKQGFHYYRLSPQGALWEGIVGARDLGVFVPARVQNATLELFGLKR
jgi:type VI secretion system protein ImpJ